MAYNGKILTRVFHTEIPGELIPIHQELQRVYNLILDDDPMRNILMNKIDYTVGVGKVWNQMGQCFKAFVYGELQDKIPNKAWFARMVYENLRRTVESLRDKIEIFKILKKHNFEINKELKDELHSMGLFPTHGGLENLKDAGKCPELPRKASFVMDYSVYNSQMFLKDNTRMKFKYNKKNWVDLDIILPASLRSKLTGKLGQPSFYYKNGQYVGDIRYYVQAHKQPKGKNILGVDYGRKYVYSASVLYEDGTTSQQYLPSGRLQGLNYKKEKLGDEIDHIYSKIEKVKPYLASNKALNTTSSRQSNRSQNDLNNRQKIINIKEQEAILSAVELVAIALQNNCGEIHIDYLKWLKSKGGKWNFAACQEQLTSIAELFGIRVIVVNTAYSSQTHPITGELGGESDREIVYSDGEKLDRDFVASINHSKRRGFKDKDLPERKVRKINKRSHKKAKRVSNKEEKRKMKEILDAKRSIEIVVPSPTEPNPNHTGLDYERRLEVGSTTKSSLTKGHVFERIALPRRKFKNVTKCH